MAHSPPFCFLGLLLASAIVTLNVVNSARTSTWIYMKDGTSTITCKYHGLHEVRGFLFYKNKEAKVSIGFPQCMVGFHNTEGEVIKNLSTVYNVTCPQPKTVEVTINTITDKMDGDVWRCESIIVRSGNEVSNNLALNVSFFGKVDGGSILHVAPNPIKGNYTITLSCEHLGINTPKAYFFNRNSKTVGVFLADCLTGTMPNHTAVYSVACPRERHMQLTIRNVTREMEGDVWFCDTVTETVTYSSNRITIRVEDPVTPSKLPETTIHVSTREFESETEEIWSTLTSKIMTETRKQSETTTVTGSSETWSTELTNHSEVTSMNTTDVLYINSTVAPSFSPDVDNSRLNGGDIRLHWTVAVVVGGAAFVVAVSAAIIAFACRHRDKSKDNVINQMRRRDVCNNGMDDYTVDIGRIVSNTYEACIDTIGDDGYLHPRYSIGDGFGKGIYGCIEVDTQTTRC